MLGLMGFIGIAFAAAAAITAIGAGISAYNSYQESERAEEHLEEMTALQKAEHQKTKKLAKFNQAVKAKIQQRSENEQAAQGLAVAAATTLLAGRTNRNARKKEAQLHGTNIAGRIQRRPAGNPNQTI